MVLRQHMTDVSILVLEASYQADVAVSKVSVSIEPGEGDEAGHVEVSVHTVEERGAALFAERHGLTEDPGKAERLAPGSRAWSGWARPGGIPAVRYVLYSTPATPKTPDSLSDRQQDAATDASAPTATRTTHEEKK